MTRGITEWIRLSSNVAHDHGWNAVDNIHRSLLLVVGEITEAQNELRNHHPYSEIYLDGDKPEGFGIELADAVFRIFNIAADCGVDLEDCMARKHAYNIRRPFMHGGKAF